jgi:diaminohydroxyphosphoribosylaminopyrimidine deaminase/5-amino-6-(5-phosphoribosylamino)uracil reductase
VTEVHAAVADPNPRVSGQGRALLEAAGIRFSWGPRAEEGRDLIADFSTWIRSSRPFITLKWAQDLAGELRYPGPEGPWISGPESRVQAHRLRADHDTVVVGAGTLRTDDPELTVRFGEPGPNGQPRRLVWAGSEPLPTGSRVFQDGHTALTWLLVRRDSQAHRQAPSLVGSRFLVWDGEDWESLGHQFLAQGFHRLLVEGGPTLLASLRSRGWWDRTAVFTAPRWVEGPGLTLASSQWTPLGNDILLEGWNPEASCLRA